MVVETDPSQLFQTPGTEGRRAILAIPSVGAPSHKPPASDSGAVLFGSVVRQVVEIGEPESMPELVCHGAHRLGKISLLLQGSMANASNDHYPASSSVPVGTFVHNRPEVSNTGCTTQNEILRSGQGVYEDIVDVSVVVAGVD